MEGRAEEEERVGESAEGRVEVGGGEEETEGGGLGLAV